MTRTRWLGLIGGLVAFAIMLLAPAPAGMELTAWHVAALTVLMAIWWMTEALPLTVTALLPFLLTPLFGVMNAGAIAKEYYSPILFLLLGGAFLALAIERVGLHRRLALALLARAGDSAWGVIMMFGGGLALAAAITESGLADWLGVVLAPLRTVHPLIVACVLTGLVILITEFASNVATASGVMPVVAALIGATGVDPLLLAMPTAFAASWGYMMPSGTGPNALAWSTGHVAMPSILKAGLWLDLAGIPLMVGTVWGIAALA